ncbi:hypothetical protein [Nocardia sp. NPDC057030]|uniref:hypothetical protein n=1 Tax=unclassified Nocardia TaxID=2637762 RepID=UPI0036398A7E
MRYRPDHNDDDPDNHTPNDPTPAPAESQEPKTIGDILASEFASFLADAVAKVPPPQTDPAYEPEPPTRPNLHLVTTEPEPAAAAPAGRDEPFTADDAVTAARTARRKVARAAAGGSAVVVAAVAFAGWGEPPIVTGPLAVYGTGWLAYLWWNAALRPSIGQILAAGIGGVRTAFAVVLTTLAGIAHGLVERVGTARTRHETTRTSPAKPPA